MTDGLSLDVTQKARQQQAFPPQITIAERRPIPKLFRLKTAPKNDQKNARKTG
jgi:hypothetical protein